MHGSKQRIARAGLQDRETGEVQSDRDSIRLHLFFILEMIREIVAHHKCFDYL